MYKSYVFRLYPNKKQQQIINQSIGNARFVYNYFLNAKKEEYKEKGYSKTVYYNIPISMDI